MYKISRRTLFASTAALAVAAATRAAWAAWVEPVDIVVGVGPPVAPVRPVVERYFGQSVTDRYRWMESEDAEWQAYVRAQGAYTAQILGKIPGRDELRTAIARSTGAVAIVVLVQTGGTLIFTELRPAGANTSKLYVRDGLGGTDRLLIDPDATATSGAHNELDWWQASPDGSHVVFGMSSSGSEESILRVIVSATGALLPEGITRTNWASPSWLPDGSGFYYNRLQDVPPDSLAYEENSLCWLHVVGTDAATDQKVFGQGLVQGIAVRDIDAPNVYATPGSGILIGVLEAGVQNELTLYAGKLGTNPGWQKICGPEDDVTAYAVSGADIFLLTHSHAPRYRIVKVTAKKPNIADAVNVVPQSEAVIRGIATGRDGLYILDLTAGLSGVRRLGADGALTRLALPFTGAIDQSAFYADTLHEGAWFPLESWVRPAVICHGTARGVTQTSLAPQPDIDVSPYVSEEVFAQARDNTRIPLSIVYRKGLQRDGTAPLLLEAYGAYGITLDPYFLARWLATGV